MTVLLFHKQTIQEFTWTSEIREIVFSSSVAPDAGGKRIEVACLANQIKCNIRQRNILLQNGPVTCPLAVAVAQYQCIVGKV